MNFCMSGPLYAVVLDYQDEVLLDTSLRLGTADAVPNKVRETVGMGSVSGLGPAGQCRLRGPCYQSCMHAGREQRASC